jgi:hypothetical protein
VKDWVTAINAARQPPEGWCYPHRFGSFAPPRGLMEDGSMVQWFIDGQAAFEAIASSIEEAKSEVSFFISFISYCRIIPYMYASQITEWWCRYLLLAGGFAQSCIFDAHSNILGYLGLMLYWKQELSRVYRYYFLITKGQELCMWWKTRCLNFEATFPPLITKLVPNVTSDEVLNMFVVEIIKWVITAHTGTFVVFQIPQSISKRLP